MSLLEAGWLFISSLSGCCSRAGLGALCFRGLRLAATYTAEQGMRLAAAWGLATLLLGCCSSLGLMAFCLWTCAWQLSVH